MFFHYLWIFYFFMFFCDDEHKNQERKEKKVSEWNKDEMKADLDTIRHNKIPHAGMNKDNVMWEWKKATDFITDGQSALLFDWFLYLAKSNKEICDHGVDSR